MNYNRLFRISSIILFLLFLSNLSFAIGVYTDAGDYVYYINNNNPTISINISSPLEDITILGAKINLNGVDKNINSFQNIYLGPTSSINKVLIFKLSNFSINNITSDDKLYFHLNVEDSNHETIKPKGDPINFKIQLDTIKPRLISFENKDKIVLGINGGYDVDFDFSKKISSYIVKINNVLVQNYTNPSKFEKDFLTQYVKTFTSDILNEGENNFTIKYFDLAGNFNEISIPMYFRAEDLKLTLLTIRDDPSLQYNYNENYPQLFNNTIYTKSDVFDLKVKTSKKSTCYFSNSLIGFDYIENIIPDNRKIFSTSDNLIHSINVDITKGSKIWVFCRNNAYSDDSLYLSNVLNMGKSLITIKKFDSSPVKINSISPDKVATYSPVNLSLSTSIKAVCSYSLNGQDESVLDSLNNLFHTKSLPLNTGNQKLDFSCVDVLNNIASKSINLNVDLNAGVQISNQDPLYTDKSSVDLKFSISENSECRYSYENVNPQEFSNLSRATGEGLQRVIPLSNLVVGNNSIYLYCRKGEGIGKKKINVVFDPEGPKISEVRFVNNNIESDYVGSYSSIHLKFNVTSLTPMSKYYINVLYGNSSTVLGFNETSSDNILSGDFQNAASIEIIGENIIGKKSLKISKNLLFDVEKPEVKISFDNNFVKIVCFDVGGSGCLNIYYELSKTSVCIPTKTYYENVSVDISNNNYVCAKVTDKAGNSKSTLEPVIFNSFDNTNNNSEIIPEETQNLTNQSPVDNTSSGLTYLNDTDVFSNSNSSNLNNLDNGSGINYLLISALALVLVGIGSGSYYAYKKGYLNKELSKLGIKLPNNNPSGSKNPINSRFAFKSQKDKKEEEKFKHSISKSNYEKHKEKLNNFLDNQISKGDKLFNNFDSEGRSKSNLDSLNNFKTKKSKISKEDVDEFYNSSLNKSINKNNNVKVDAKDFEEYYKKKKKNLNSKKSSKK